MSDLEVLFLFERPPNGKDQQSLDSWVAQSPWSRRFGKWTIWSISYGGIPENLLEAKSIVAVGAKATRYVLDTPGVVLYTQGLKPRPMKPNPKIVNRVYKIQKIEGFGSARFFLALKTAGQLAMSAKFAEQSGFAVKPVGDRKTVESLWQLFMHLSAKPILQGKPLYSDRNSET